MDQSVFHHDCYSLSATRVIISFQDYRLDTIVEMINHKQQEIGMYEMQILAQNDETKRLRNFLAEADLELEVRHL